MKLLNLTKRVKDLLQITKLYTVFDVFDEDEHRDPQLRVGSRHRDSDRSRRALPLSGSVLFRFTAPAPSFKQQMSAVMG